jgi:hypothetical protein
MRRRQLFSSVIGATASAGVATIMTMGGVAENACAACMPGDLSPECIGVYKTALEADPETIKQYAPDLKFVPPPASPKSYQAALEAVQAQRRAADDIAEQVQAGRLEEAGIKVLNLIPKFSVSGQLLVDVRSSDIGSDAAIQGLRRQQLTELLQTAEIAWKNADVAIGQGLRGNLGVSAVAQIRILEEIKEATQALDEFLFAVEKKAQ